MTTYVIRFDARFDHHSVSYINDTGRGDNGNVWGDTPERCIQDQIEKASVYGWTISRIEVLDSKTSRLVQAYPAI